MIKQKQYDWKDSNLALFGSDTERQVKSKYSHQLRNNRGYAILIHVTGAWNSMMHVV